MPNPKKKPKPNTLRKKNPRTTREANAELLLLQSLALRVGQEAARQNGISTSPYLPLNDPRGVSLATLEGVGEEPIKLRATVTLTVNPNTGAIIDITPPPSSPHHA